MLNQFTIIRIIVTFILPYIILYSLYIQMNGEVSPGGGFQAGAILASALIAIDLISTQTILSNIFTKRYLTIYASLGVLLYAGVGLLTILLGGDFLDYDYLSKNNISGQHIGIFLIELGVLMTVSSSLYLIYLLLYNKKK